MTREIHGDFYSQSVGIIKYKWSIYKSVEHVGFEITYGRLVGLVFFFVIDCVYVHETTH